MKKHLKYLLLLVTVISLLILLSCSKKTNVKSLNTNESIAGKWLIDEDTFIELNDDFTFDIYLKDQNKSKTIIEGSYSFCNGDEATELLDISDEEYEEKFQEYVGEKDLIYKLILNAKNTVADGLIEIVDESPTKEYMVLINKNKLESKLISLDTYKEMSAIRN